MKTYFNYEGQIKSKEVSEAIAFPIGMGPFMGFGSAKVQSSSITLYPKAPTEQVAEGAKPYYKDINDRILARNLSLRGENSIPSFGLINRTGHLWVSTQPQVEINNIRGTRGAWDEVLVFAVFQDIESPVINKPTLIAYWNSSNQSFYEYWKKSLDYTYGLDNIPDTDPWESTLSFEDLVSKVSAVVPEYDTTNTMVLIGVYGTGVDANTNNLETFALVPYCGNFPQSVPFTLDYYYALKRRIKTLSDFAMGGLDGYDTIKAYIDKKLGELNQDKEQPGTIPIGGIIAWSGSSIPDGWAICDGNQGTPNLSGKFILGSGGDYALGDSGGQSEVTLGENNLPAHSHELKDYYYPEQASALGSIGGNWGYDSLSIPRNSGSGDTDWDNQGIAWYKHNTDNTGKGVPVPIMPPYAVLIYIMRIR